MAECLFAVGCASVVTDGGVGDTVAYFKGTSIHLMALRFR